MIFCKKKLNEIIDLKSGIYFEPLVEKKES